MSHSFTSLAYHFVFATKHRQPLLVPEIRLKLFRHMGGVINELGGRHIITNGPLDHAHQLCFLPPDLTVAEVMRKVKSYSSGWVHRTFPEMPEFAWQCGYGAFSVGRREVDVIRNYIARQLKHHNVKPFEEELFVLLREHDVEFDERYIFE
jgi:putative transposase